MKKKRALEGARRWRLRTVSHQNPIRSDPPASSASTKAPAETGATSDERDSR